MAKDKEWELNDDEAWETGSGLPEDYRGKIKSAWFEFDDDYQDGDALVLKLEIETNDESIGDNGTVVEMLPAGKGWTTPPKGKGEMAVREDGKRPIFNNQSGCGLLVDSFMEVATDEQKAALKKKGHPTKAAVWVGVEGDFKRRSFTSTIGGEEVTWGRMLFDPEGEIVEVGGSTSAAKAAGKSSGSAKVKADPPPADDETSDETGDEGGDETPAASSGVPAALKLKLKAAAKGKTHDEFLEAAMSIDGVDGNADAEALIMDSAADSLWATGGGVEG